MTVFLVFFDYAGEVDLSKVCSTRAKAEEFIATQVAYDQPFYRIAEWEVDGEEK